MTDEPTVSETNAAEPGQASKTVTITREPFNGIRVKGDLLAKLKDLFSNVRSDEDDEPRDC